MINNIEECKRIYDLGTNVQEYKILSVKEV